MSVWEERLFGCEGWNWRIAVSAKRNEALVSIAAAKASVVRASVRFPASFWARARPIYASTILSLTSTALLNCCAARRGLSMRRYWVPSLMFASRKSGEV